MYQQHVTSVLQLEICMNGSMYTNKCGSFFLQVSRFFFSHIAELESFQIGRDPGSLLNQLLRAVLTNNFKTGCSGLCHMVAENH